jgi:hypothetical protein
MLQRWSYINSRHSCDGPKFCNSNLILQSIWVTLWEPRCFCFCWTHFLWYINKHQNMSYKFCKYNILKKIHYRDNNRFLEWKTYFFCDHHMKLCDQYSLSIKLFKNEIKFFEKRIALLFMSYILEFFTVCTFYNNYFKSKMKYILKMFQKT